MLKGLSQEWACPKHVEGHVPREGLFRVATITLHYLMLHCLLFSLSDAAMTYNAIVVQKLKQKIPSDTQVSPTRENRRACRH